MKNKPAGAKPVKPPENYREMIDKNISLAKVMYDIFDTYSGVLANQIKEQPKKEKK
jgi:hypothetical protein